MNIENYSKIIIIMILIKQNISCVNQINIKKMQFILKIKMMINIYQFLIIILLKIWINKDNKNHKNTVIINGKEKK